MPRPQREDKEPVIMVREDIYIKRNHAREAVNDTSLEVAVFRKRKYPEFYTTVYAELENRLAEIRKRRKDFDAGVLYMMLSLCPVAVSKPASPDNVDADLEPNYQWHVLKKVGCRVEMTVKELAERYNVSESTIQRNIQIMREEDLIVNWGKGWNEFDANLAWRGPHDLRSAYLPFQRCRQKIVITDGKTTLTWGTD